MIHRGTSFYLREALEWALVLLIAVPLTLFVAVAILLPLFVFVVSIFVPR